MRLKNFNRQTSLYRHLIIMDSLVCPWGKKALQTHSNTGTFYIPLNVHINRVWPDSTQKCFLLHSLQYHHHYYHCHFRHYYYNHNYNKILKSDWLSTALISALIWQYVPSGTHINSFFSLLAKIFFEFLVFWFKKRPLYVTNFVKVMINWQQNFEITQIGLPLCNRLILLITRLITDWIGFHSVRLPLLAINIIYYNFNL